MDLTLYAPTLSEGRAFSRLLRRLPVDRHGPAAEGLSSSFNNRTDHSLFIDGSYQICKGAIAQLSYRFEYSHYTSTERRDDYCNTIGAALYCPLCQHAGLRLFANYDIFDTNGKYVSDYNRFEGGVGANLSLRF